MVRHGKTEWNAAERLQGHLDSPMTEEGVRLSERIGQRLTGIHSDALYSSDLGRAMQTAEVIGRWTGVAPEARPELRECSWGRWEGKTWGELRRDYAAQMDRRREDLQFFRPPGGESYADAERRVAPFLRFLLNGVEKRTICIVAHNMINRALMRLALDISFEEACQLRQDHHQVYRLEIQGESRSHELLEIEGAG